MCIRDSYGPMGYDIGNVVANLIFAGDNGRAAGADEFCDWALKAIEELSLIHI